MARRDIGHVPRGNTRNSSWAETPARPPSRPATGRGRRSEEPQWPEGSWWSEQPDWTERGRRASPREPSRRVRKRHKAGARPHQRERPRPGPKAGPRRGRRPTDRLGIGAITLAAVVGLALLGIAERALLDGGPFGGAPGPAGSHHSMKPPPPSPPEDGAGPSGAPPVAATEKRSPNGANSQQ